MHRFIDFLAHALLIPAVVVGMAAVSSAGQLTYTSLPLPVPDTRAADLLASTAAETQFFSTLSSHGTDTLDTTPAANVGVPNPTLTFGASGITATTTFGPLGVQGVSSFFAVSGGNALVEYPDPTYTNVISLSQFVTAFGSYFIQVGDVDADTVTLRLTNTQLGTSKDVVVGTAGPGASNNSVFYFGVTDTDPFNQVQLLLSNAADGIILDSITAGTVAVPEPGAMFLLAAGAMLPLLVGVRRRAATPK